MIESKKFHQSTQPPLAFEDKPVLPGQGYRLLECTLRYLKWLAPAPHRLACLKTGASVFQVTSSLTAEMTKATGNIMRSVGTKMDVKIQAGRGKINEANCLPITRAQYGTRSTSFQTDAGLPEQGKQESHDQPQALRATMLTSRENGLILFCCVAPAHHSVMTCLTRAAAMKFAWLPVLSISLPSCQHCSQRPLAYHS